MTWGDVKQGDVLEWEVDPSELYLVLRREPYPGPTYKERLVLLNLLDGEVVPWPMFHPQEQDLSVVRVAKVGA